MQINIYRSVEFLIFICFKYKLSLYSLIFNNGHVRQHTKFLQASSNQLQYNQCGAHTLVLTDIKFQKNQRREIPFCPLSDYMTLYQPSLRGGETVP